MPEWCRNCGHAETDHHIWGHDKQGNKTRAEAPCGVGLADNTACGCVRWWPGGKEFRKDA